MDASYWLIPETRDHGTWDEPLRPYRAEWVGESEETRIARQTENLRNAPTWHFGLDQG